MSEETKGLILVSVIGAWVLGLVFFTSKVNQVRELEKQVVNLQQELKQAKTTQKVVTKTITKCEEYIDQEIDNICSEYVSDHTDDICSDYGQDSKEGLTCEYDTRGKVCY